MEPPAASSSTAPVLAVRDLQVGVYGSSTRLLDITGFDLTGGEVVGLMGAPGAGKTIFARAIMGLLPPGVTIERGSIRLLGEELKIAPDRRLDELRGRILSMIFQSPEQALDPLAPCFYQLAEPFRGSGLTRQELTEKFLEALRSLGFSDPARILRSRPAALSGGERQRVLLAIATARAPVLLIADEPTSGLDPDLQLEFVSTARARARSGLATLLISHDRKVIESAADRIIQMEAGRLVDLQLFRAPFPRPSATNEEPTPLLEVSQLYIQRGQTDIVRDLSFRVNAGQALGVVGASGAGKTSLARVLAGLLPPSSGTISLHVTRPGRHPQVVQLIYQDPASSLNPAMTVGEAVLEPMLLRGLNREDAEDRLENLLTRVGIGRELAKRTPNSLSGGQQQLTAIARALAADPALLVLDEPTASLSEVAAGAVLELLRDLLEERRLGVVLASHDIALVEGFCDTVVTLTLNKPEVGRTESPQISG